MSRRAFVIYICIMASLIAGFALSDDLPRFLRSYEGQFWTWGAIMLLLLPLVQSMRLHNMGRSPFWPILPFAGLLIMAISVMSSLASVSGAPDGKRSPLETAADIAGIVSLAIVAVITLYCFLPSRPAADPHEVS